MDHLAATEGRVRLARKRFKRGKDVDARRALIKAIRHLTKAVLNSARK